MGWLVGMKAARAERFKVEMGDWRGEWLLVCLPRFVSSRLVSSRFAGSRLSACSSLPLSVSTCVV